MTSLGWMDYVSLMIALVIPSLITLYFGVTSSGRKTVSSKLGVFPVSMSMVASALSGGFMVGIPSEVYSNGIIFPAYFFWSNLISIGINIFYFIPVLYNIKMDSVYAYFDLRFSASIRKLASFIFIISQICYAAFAAYPSAALISQFSGLSFDLCGQSLMIFCTICTLIGGFKGVVWTDTFQAMIMMTFSIAFVILSCIDGGGLIKIFEAAKESGRLEFFVMDPDPTIRTSFWSGTLGQIVLCCINSILNPSSFQRYSSLRSEREARWAAVLMGLTINAFLVFLAFGGLGMYSSFRGCDPKKAGVMLLKIVSNYVDNYFYYMERLGKATVGLNGLFISSVLSASLSTMSTNINTAATLLHVEFVKNWRVASRISDANSVKVLSGLVGFASMGLLFLMKGIDSITNIFQMFFGATGGLIVGLFVLGMFFLDANAKGTFWAGSISLCLMLPLVIGPRLYPSNPVDNAVKLLTVDQCPFNVTSMTQSKVSIIQTCILPWVFRITPNYYPFIALASTVILGLLLSRLMPTETQGTGSLKKELFCSSAVNLNRERFYQEIPLKECLRESKPCP